MNFLFTACCSLVSPLAPLLLLVITHNKGYAREDQQRQNDFVSLEFELEITVGVTSFKHWVMVRV